jgi:hypothetical protein
MKLRKNSNYRINYRAAALVALLVVLPPVYTRLRADIETTGCGGLNIPFTDVAGGSIFFCSIASAYFLGLTNGTSPTTYSPADPVPREQMAAIITRTHDSALRRGSRRAALNQWWIPTASHGIPTTLVGESPQAVQSDGADLWVANQFSFTVSRVPASDGKLLGTWTNAAARRHPIGRLGRLSTGCRLTVMSCS